jgi:glycosyltransferase involved in cell wall biosynthesis
MNDYSKITILLVNYKTLELTKICLESFRFFYPNINILLIDNGSQDQSTTYIQEIAAFDERITGIINSKNLNHGPALHQGITQIQSRFVLTLDTDCQVIRLGFLEKMVHFFNEPKTYAVGSLVTLDRFGYQVSPYHKLSYSAYIQPYCMLIDRQKYLQFKPFMHHGSPCLHNLKEAESNGYQLVDFPVYEYVIHFGCGTCSKYGYNLGARHKLENILHHLQFYFLSLL